MVSPRAELVAHHLLDRDQVQLAAGSLDTADDVALSVDKKCRRQLPGRAELGDHHRVTRIDDLEAEAEVGILQKDLRRLQRGILDLFGRGRQPVQHQRPGGEGTALRQETPRYET